MTKPDCKLCSVLCWWTCRGWV